MWSNGGLHFLQHNVYVSIPKWHKPIVVAMERNYIFPQTINSIEVVLFFWPSFFPRSFISLTIFLAQRGLMWTRLRCYRIVLLVFNWRVTRLKMISCILFYFAWNIRRTSGLLSLLDWHGNQHAISSSHHPQNFCLWDSESAKILLVESGIQGTGIWNTAQGNRNSTNNRNPEIKFHCERLESSTWNPESAAWNPRSKRPRLSWIPFHGATYILLPLPCLSFHFIHLSCNNALLSCQKRCT